MDVAGTGYGRCGMLSVGLRPNEDEWFAPFAELVLRRSPGEIAEITPEEASSLFPPLGPGAPRAARARFGAGRRAWHGRRAPPAAVARGVVFVPGAAHGVQVGGVGAGAGSGHRVEAVEVEGHQNVACGAVAVAGGAWTAAAGEWLGTRLPIGPTKGQIVHLGVGAETGDVADRAAAAHPLSRALARGPGGLRRHVRGHSRVLRQRDRGGSPRAAARVPDGGAGAERRRPTSRRGWGCGPRRPTIAPSWAGYRVGATPGWRPDTAPTACCKAPIPARVLAHEMAGVDQPADEAPLPGSFDPSRFA